MRNKTIDFIKGVAIILMVIGHSGLSGAPVRFIYLFHMPVFFMASGYFFSSKNVNTVAQLGTYLKKRVIKIWIPYVVWSMVLFSLHNVFVQYGASSENAWTVSTTLFNLKWSLFMMATPHKAFWFLKSLFIAAVTYGAVGYVIRRVSRDDFWYQGVIALVLVFLGRYVESFGLVTFYIGGQHSALTAYFLLHLGRTLKRYEFIATSAIATASMIVLFIMLPFPRFELADNCYPGVFSLVMAAMAGWSLLQYFHQVLSRWPLMRETIILIGQRTMPILIFHYLAFMIAPSGKVWDRSIVGVVVPLILYETYRKVWVWLAK